MTPKAAQPLSAPPTNVSRATRWLRILANEIDRGLVSAVDEQLTAISKLLGFQPSASPKDALKPFAQRIKDLDTWFDRAPETSHRSWQAGTRELCERAYDAGRASSAETPAGQTDEESTAAETLAELVTILGCDPSEILEDVQRLKWAARWQTPASSAERTEP